MKKLKLSKTIQVILATLIVIIIACILATIISNYNVSASEEETKGEEICEHNYIVNDNEDGTHSISCTKCNYKVNVGHTYYCGMCICGAKTELGNCLECGTKLSIKGSETGHSEYCSKCDAAYAIPLQGVNAHDFGEYNITDKEEDSTHARVCRVCNYIETKEHSYQKDGTCKYCGYKDPIYGECTHQYDGYSPAKYEDETRPIRKYGYHTSTCTLCGFNLEEECNCDENGVCIDCGYTNPNYKNCAHKGTYIPTEYSHEEVCILCGESMETEWSPGIVVLPSHSSETYTKNGDGTHTGTCTVCKYTFTNECLIWDYVENGDGTHTGTCNKCGYTSTEECNNAKYSDNGDGTHTIECSVCNYGETIETHTWKEESNNDKTHSRVCIGCELRDYTEGHDFEIINNGDGTHTKTCNECGFTLTEAHNQNGTDNEDGTHTAICEDCEYEVTEEHNYKIIYEDKASNGGTHHIKICEICANQQTEEHNISGINNGDGTHTIKCLGCGYIQKAGRTYIRKCNSR